MVEVIKKFAHPARVMATRSKTTGLEQTNDGTALALATEQPLPLPFLCTAAFKGQVLQLLLLYLGLHLMRLSAFPQQKQQNKQNLMVARARCVMYYGQPCAQNENEAGCCTETALKCK